MDGRQVNVGDMGNIGGEVLRPILKIRLKSRRLRLGYADNPKNLQMARRLLLELKISRRMCMGVGGVRVCVCGDLPE